MKRWETLGRPPKGCTNLENNSSLCFQTAYIVCTFM